MRGFGGVTSEGLEVGRQWGQRTSGVEALQKWDLKAVPPAGSRSRG